MALMREAGQSKTRAKRCFNIVHILICRDNINNNKMVERGASISMASLRDWSNKLMSISRGDQEFSKEKRRRARHRNLVAKNSFKLYSSYSLKDARIYDRRKQRMDEFEDYW